MKLPPTRLLLLAVAIPATLPAAGRRVVERAPSPAPAAIGPAVTATTELTDRLERMRLEVQYGTDWDEAIIETSDVDGLTRKHGGNWRAHGLGRDAVTAPGGRRPVDWFLEVANDPLVTHAEPNPRATHPGCRQMSIDILEAGTQYVPVLVTQDALRMSSAESVSADGVTVAVVDSGVAPLPELDGRLLPTIDVLHPHGPVTVTDEGELLEHADDVNGHGTAMATLIASIAEGASILPVRVVGSDCEGTAFDLATGLTQAADAGARVALVSLSMPFDSPVLRRAVEDVTSRGMLIVAAAGNSGVVEYPAAYPGVIAVTAVGSDGWPPDFAPQGGAVALAAPGVRVEAVGPTDLVALTGTSPAAAVVAGAAARVVSMMPADGPATWASALRSSARPASDLSPYLEGRLGAGFLDFTPLK